MSTNKDCCCLKIKKICTDVPQTFFLSIYLLNYRVRQFSIVDVVYLLKYVLVSELLTVIKQEIVL